MNHHPKSGAYRLVGGGERPAHGPLAQSVDAAVSKAVIFRVRVPRGPYGAVSLTGKAAVLKIASSQKGCVGSSPPRLASGSSTFVTNAGARLERHRRLSPLPPCGEITADNNSDSRKDGISRHRSVGRAPEG